MPRKTPRGNGRGRKPKRTMPPAAQREYVPRIVRGRNNVDRIVVQHGKLKISIPVLKETHIKERKSDGRPRVEWNFNVGPEILKDFNLTDYAIRLVTYFARAEGVDYIQFRDSPQFFTEHANFGHLLIKWGFTNRLYRTPGEEPVMVFRKQLY